MEEILSWLVWCSDCGQWHIVDELELNEEVETVCPECAKSKVVCISICYDDLCKFSKSTQVKIRNYLDRLLRTMSKCTVCGAYLEDSHTVEYSSIEIQDEVGEETKPDIRINKNDWNDE